MAEEKPRAPRAQKKVTETEKDVAASKSTAKRAKAATSTPKSAKKKTAAATSRPRQAKVVAVQPDDVATLAYLLWERGEPGDADEHWLRAEQELAAA
jgi:hypothetical protein